MPLSEMSQAGKTNTAGLASIKKMSHATKAFSKDTDEAAKKTGELRKKEAELDKQLAKGQTFANKYSTALRGMEKAYAELGSEVNHLDLNRTYMGYNKAADGAKKLTKELHGAQKEVKTLDDVSSAAAKNSSGIQKLLSNQDFKQMAAALVIEGGTAWGKSAFGDDGGAIVSSALTSAISGGAIGFSIGGPVGALIGAGVGALAGIVSGNIQKFEKQDDYFKAYYNNILDEQAETKAKDIETGSSIAAGREVDELALSRAFGGDTKEAEEHMKGLVAMSHETPLSYEALVAMSKTMAGQGVGSKEILSTLKAVGAAGTALELDVGAMNTMAAALGQMKSSDVVTAEQLQALDNLGIDATGLLAAKKRMSVEEASQAVAQGEISGSEAATLLQAAMETKYGSSMTAQMETFAGLSSTLEGWKQEMQSAYGEGYNETRKEGIQADITAYSGAMGEKRIELNQASGSLAAYRENLQEQYKREAASAVLAGGGLSDIWDAEQAEELNKMSANYQMLQLQYEQGDQEAGLKMARLEEQAEALAQVAYDNSEWAKTELTVEEENTKAVRALTEKLEAGILLRYQVEQSKTIGSKGASDTDFFTVNGGQGVTTNTTQTEIPWIASESDGYKLLDGSAAIGLDRVPYDGYAALLHEGERVLTAREVRAADRGGGGKSFVIHVTGNTFQTGQGGGVGDIAHQLADQILLELDKGVL